MNRPISIIAFSLLSALVLLGSGGLTLGKIICGVGPCSTTEYTLGKAKDCCSGESDGIVKDCCCELIDVTLDLDEFNTTEKLTVESNISWLISFPAPYCLLPASSFKAETSDHTESPPSPPSVLSLRSLRL